MPSIDKEISARLRQMAPVADDNPWFTARVMSRLPWRRTAHTARWLRTAGIAVCVLLIVASWSAYFATHFHDGVVTVGGACSLVVMVAATYHLVIAAVHGMLQAD